MQIGAVGLIATLVAIAGWWAWAHRSPFYERSFNSDVWKIHPTERRSPRGLMVGDLVDRVLRQGMARSSVHHILGAPDLTLTAGDLKRRGWADGNKESGEYYRLGYWSGLGVDEDILVLTYGVGDRLLGFFVIQT